jgi:hypothetical protein
MSAPRLIQHPHWLDSRRSTLKKLPKRIGVGKEIAWKAQRSVMSKHLKALLPDAVPQ